MSNEPRTSPLTEEEAAAIAEELARGLVENPAWDYDGASDVEREYYRKFARQGFERARPLLEAALLRVDSEARADLDEAVRQAVYDVLDDVADLDDGETDVLATVKMWRDDPGAYSRLRDDARHPTPSTPTTTEET